MKILIVSPLPIHYPPTDGHSLNIVYRSYFLKSIANISSDIIVPYKNKSDIGKLETSNVFEHTFGYPSQNKWYALVRFLFSKGFYDMFNLDDENLKNILHKLDTNYEVIIFDHSYSYKNYEKLINHINVNNNNIIYWSHNIDYIDYKNYALEATNIFRKLFYYLNYQKLKTIEPAYIKKFRKIASVSKYEVDILKNINNKAKIYWIPPMLPEFKDLEVKKEDIDMLEEKVGKYHHKILFTGLLKKSSNIKAALWFGKDVFPLIKKKLKACFIIVGQSPSKEVIEFVDNKEDIFLFKDVESLAPFYKLSDLVVVPLFNPAGIKLKLLEALKYKKKVVARKEDLLGAGLENIVPNAQDKEDFAKKCIDVLEGKIDYNIVWNEFERIYDNKRIVNLLLELLEIKK
ncbi:MAG: glycosyltransferase family 4 protein [Hydrogenobaculum sp.]